METGRQQNGNGCRPVFFRTGGNFCFSITDFNLRLFPFVLDGNDSRESGFVIGIGEGTKGNVFGGGNLCDVVSAVQEQEGGEIQLLPVTVTPPSDEPFGQFQPAEAAGSVVIRERVIGLPFAVGIETLHADELPSRGVEVEKRVAVSGLELFLSFASGLEIALRGDADGQSCLVQFHKGLVAVAPVGFAATADKPCAVGIGSKLHPCVSVGNPFGGGERESGKCFPFIFKSDGLPIQIPDLFRAIPVVRIRAREFSVCEQDAWSAVHTGWFPTVVFIAGRQPDSCRQQSGGDCVGKKTFVHLDLLLGFCIKMMHWREKGLQWGSSNFFAMENKNK